ncbi:MAG: hypothetical protein WCV84_03195 [Patescibacteria group bacterium]
MALVLNRLEPGAEVEVVDPTRVRFRDASGWTSVPLLRDVLAEGDAFAHDLRTYTEKDARISFVGHAADLRVQSRGNWRFFHPLVELTWRHTDDDGKPMRFCGRMFMPKDILSALSHILTGVELLDDDPRLTFWKRMRLLRIKIGA